MNPSRQATACARFADDLALLAGGDRPMHEPAGVDVHLASCASCRDDLVATREALRWAARTAALHPDFSPSALTRLRARTMAAVRAEARLPAAWWRRYGLSLAGAAAMAAVTLLGLPRISGRGQDVSRSEPGTLAVTGKASSSLAPGESVDGEAGEDLWATLTAHEADDIAAAPAPVRRMKIELRTLDPAIRIVWLAPN